MQEVKLVDQDAITFLSHCEDSGAQLRNCPGYIGNGSSVTGTQTAGVTKGAR
jgi:hypothetical protein